ncbi:MAG: class I SAM-dependent methyltransferase [Gudongella sp.]|nr:class I SAM-dependent methyltransferase [Gudongella sp.]
MKSDRLNNALQFTELIIKSYVKQGNICIDATAGNGNDTEVLAMTVGPEGKVYAFDIQEQALETTKFRLGAKELLNRVVLVNDSHENICAHVEGPVDFIIYNLGYLPGGDKSVATKKETTLKSLQESLTLLSSKGLMAITCYRGHEGGEEEYSAVMEFVSELDQIKYNTFRFEFLNQKNKPPVVIGVEMRGVA